MVRRLPVYFLIDISESMAGENHSSLQRGMDDVVRDLRRDPHALETVYMSVIAFAGKVKTIAPLVELASFYPPRVPLGSGTSLGQALFHLMAEIDTNTKRTTAEYKGDWKPIVFLLTDGRPTDNYSSAFRKWKDQYKDKATLIAISIGRNVDLNVLKELTDEVLILEETSSESFKKFINWVTASISSQSLSIGSGGGNNLVLAAVDGVVLKLMQDAVDHNLYDQNNVILVGRCQKKKYPYLMKYEKAQALAITDQFKIEIPHYDFSGCYPLDEDYFTWSDESIVNIQTVNTAELNGGAGCPHCGARIALAMCACGAIMCIDAPGNAICPWCENSVSFGESSGSDFDVNRARG